MCYSDRVHSRVFDQLSDVYSDMDSQLGRYPYTAYRSQRRRHVCKACPEWQSQIDHHVASSRLLFSGHHRLGLVVVADVSVLRRAVWLEAEFVGAEMNIGASVDGQVGFDH